MQITLGNGVSMDVYCQGPKLSVNPTDPLGFLKSGVVVPEDGYVESGWIPVGGFQSFTVGLVTENGYTMTMTADFALDSEGVFLMDPENKNIDTTPWFGAFTPPIPARYVRVRIEILGQGDETLENVLLLNCA